jgi:nucleotide-binding universal stress UspA family protein
METLHHALFHPHRFVVPDKILVATSLDDTDYLIPHAVAQARACRARVTLAHIVAPRGGPLSLESGPVSPQHAFSREHQATEILNSIAGEIRKCGVACDVRVRQGIPIDEIIRIVRETAADRVLAGTCTHGRGCPGNFAGESLAEELVRRSPSPVFMVGPQARDARFIGPRRILHVVRMQRGFDEIASTALNLARFYGVDISLLCVLGKRKDFGRVTSQLKQLYSDGDSRRVHADIKVVYGDIREEAVRVGAETRADLIVLGLDPLPSVLRRDRTAYRIITEAKSPVLSVRMLPRGRVFGMRAGAALPSNRVLS